MKTWDKFIMNIGVNRIICGLLGIICKNIFHIQSEQGSLKKGDKRSFFYSYAKRIYKKT